MSNFSVSPILWHKHLIPELIFFSFIRARYEFFGLNGHCRAWWTDYYRLKRTKLVVRIIVYTPINPSKNIKDWIDQPYKLCRVFVSFPKNHFVVCIKKSLWNLLLFALIVSKPFLKIQKASLYWCHWEVCLKWGVKHIKNVWDAWSIYKKIEVMG